MALPNLNQVVLILEANTTLSTIKTEKDNGLTRDISNIQILKKKKKIYSCCFNFLPLEEINWKLIIFITAAGNVFLHVIFSSHVINWILKSLQHPICYFYLWFDRFCLNIYFDCLFKSPFFLAQICKGISTCAVYYSSYI